jgi:uncharacterized protein (DUF1697 family)
MMETYISILRGINVSGQKKILMADLKALYEGLDFENVTTYIQSGNVIFKTPKPVSDTDLAKKIESAISKKYGFEVPVIVRTHAEMERILAVNPLLKEKGIDIERLHVTFLEEEPASEKVKLIKDLDFSPDKFVIIKKEVYLHCPKGYGITKISNNFFESKLKVKATTRNWKTVNKLVTLATTDN